MKVIIVGGGRLGKSLTRLLVAEGNKVTVIEKDQKIAEQLATEIDALVLNADGTEADVLKRAELEEADALISVTRDDYVNMVASKIAKDNNVPKVISIVTEPNMAGVLDEMGVIAVNATALTVNEIHKAISVHRSKGYLTSVCHEKAAIVKFTISEKSPVLGKYISKIGVPHIFWVERGEECTAPKGNTKLLEGDTVYLVSNIEELDAISRKIAGE